VRAPASHGAGQRPDRHRPWTSGELTSRSRRLLSPNGEARRALVGQRRGRRGRTPSPDSSRATSASRRPTYPPASRRLALRIHRSDPRLSPRARPAADAARAGRPRPAAWSPREPPASPSARTRSPDAAGSRSSAPSTGLGSAVVSGEADADTWLVGRDGGSSSAASPRSGRCTSGSRRRRRAYDPSRRFRRADRAARPRRTPRFEVARLARGRAALRAPAGHRVGDRRPPVSAPVAADHLPPRAGRSRRPPRGLGQQQHRRELQRRDDAADVLVRAGDLPARLRAVLPDDGRARTHHRRARRDVPQHARAHPRPALLQPPELVPHAGAAAGLQREPGGSWSR
jgi:hypothetical protein